MNIEKVEAYKTTDGMVFAEQANAFGHQRDLDIKAAIKKIIDDHGYRGMSMEEVENIIFENHTAIVSAYNQAHGYLDPTQ
jgi:hypothetical protein